MTTTQPASLDEDKFLECHLPGTSGAVVKLRTRTRDLNSQRGQALFKTILIRGESGAGKSRLARVIAAHRHWILARAKGASEVDAPLESYFGQSYQSIHLPAVPDELSESELFGHKKGAFTGAVKDKRGLLDGEHSDILLDEIGDASHALQAKLLSVVETKKFRPLGADPDDALHETSARLLLATNRDLEDLVYKGRFREDLYWRISQFTIELPPLREQPENVEAIAKSIEAKLLKELPPEDPADERLTLLTDQDLVWAKHHAWPGNARKLEDALTLFVFEDGRRRLEVIVGEMEKRSLRVKPAADVFDDYVDRRLRAAMAGEQQVPGKLDAFLKEFERLIKRSIVAWWERNDPDAELIRRLFPDAEVDSVKSKISQWRGL